MKASYQRVAKNVHKGFAFFESYFSLQSVRLHLSRVDESMLSLSERPVTAPVNGPTLEAASWIDRPSTGFSVHSTERRSRSGSQRKASLKISQSGDRSEKSQHGPASTDHQAGRLSARKGDPWEEQSVPFRSERPSNHHDILVIHTQPPRVKKTCRLRLDRCLSCL